jgi:hypothetical protein
MTSIYKEPSKQFYRYHMYLNNIMALFYSTIIVAILLLIPIAESGRCARNFTFEGWQLNWSIPFNLYPSTNNLNNSTNESCRVRFVMDFTTGFC